MIISFFSTFLRGKKYLISIKPKKPERIGMAINIRISVVEELKNADLFDFEEKKLMSNAKMEAKDNIKEI